MTFDVCGNVFGNRRALSQNGDAFGKAEYHMHIVFDNYHGDVPTVLNLLQQIDGVVGVGPRHAGGRFVKQ